MNGMRFTVIVLSFLVLVSCKNKKAPDVSHVKVTLEVQRFEQDLFAIDTNNVNASLNQLHQKYPGFLQDYIFNILGLPAQPDSTAVVERQLIDFIRSYRLVKDSADKVFRNMDDITGEVKHGLQYVKYYFPQYKLPQRFVTFIGPINSYGNILTANELAVGLQLYMGSNYSLYQSEAGQQLYPTYISRRFQPQYIAVNSIRNIVDDMYPDRSAGRPLVEQMIEAGKRLYLLDHFLPNAEDTLKTGYTAAQLQGAYKNEELIWTYFVNNDLLFAIDPAITKDYMNEAPNTAVLGPASPGFIGQFVGWQIVKKWMDKNEKITLPKLMETDPKLIFQQAKYKP
jgi:hypothetical protein